MTKSGRRISTIRGLGPDPEEVTDDDIVEVDGEAPPVSRVTMMGNARYERDASIPPMPFAIVPRELRYCD